jgi:hypothetical protein
MSAHDQDNARPRTGIGGSEPTAAHHALIAQPHTEPDGPNAAATARISTEEPLRGLSGRARNGRSPFLVGMSAAAGVAVTAGLVEMIITARAAS